MNVVRIGIACFAVAAGLWFAATRGPAPRPPSLITTPPTPTPQPRRHIEGRFDGLAIQVYSAHDAAEKYGRLIREVAELGGGCVMLSVNGYQERVESTQIHTRAHECPSDEVWLELFDTAHAAGLKVVLMPKILLEKPGGKWRGKIQPPSWDAWFAQYSRFVLRFARIAEAGRVEMFIVGSELVSSERHTEHWRSVIGQTREVFGGVLAYSANWDHYTGIQFWEDLDVVGLTTYHKLSETPGPSLDNLRQAWKPIKRKILTWRGTVDRPIIFTEVGWCSQEGCSIEAWNYYHSEKATPAGHEEQRRNYAAFIHTWNSDPNIVGMVWWEWNESEGGSTDFSYIPRGKPAEQVLRDWFKDRSRVFPGYSNRGTLP